MSYLNYSLTVVSVFLIIPSTASSYTFYQKNQSPSYVLDQANRFKNYNPYSTKNNLHPYSDFQNPYSANSARNNSKYSQTVKTSDGLYQGKINNQLYIKNNINNPYNKYGNAYNYQHPSNGYRPQKWNNPYSQFQSPYSSKSVRNNAQKHGVQHKDSYDNQYGATHSKTYQSNSLPDTYTHSPFEADNFQNPYDKNKVFN